MKKEMIAVLLAVVLGFVSCEKNDDVKYAEYLVARPLTMLKSEFRNSVDVVAPMPVLESGKIYAYKDYIFINDKNTGVHVVDNSNPAAPRKIAFIKIPANVDISVKDDFLFADSLSDLVVIDISDINNIRQVNRLENVLYGDVIWPMEVDIFEDTQIDYNNEILIGWETVTERRPIAEYENRFNNGGIFFEAMADASANSTTGQGGSMARFKIVADYLYAVDRHNINIFDITDLENPKDMEDVFAGFDIETIFNQGQYLFLGSMSGMFIYDITTPATPTFVSEFQHGTACDPVVVDGDYAYVTLRGGNFCGATESGLFIVDISDISNPTLKISYPMDGPYGLGIKAEKLFVCDGDSGLKVFDKTDVEHLVPLNQFEDINTFDVIPLENTLLMVGKEALYQYEYLENGIELISTLHLD